MLFENLRIQKKRTFLLIFICFAVTSIFYYLQPKSAEEIAADRFAKNLNLILTLRIKEIIPTNNGRYYVLVGDIIRSNKKNNYRAKFQTSYNNYDYCLVNGNKGLIVFHCVEAKNNEEVRLNDSLVINSNQNRYWLFRKGNLVESYNLNVGSDGDFSNQLTYDLANSNYWKN